MVMDRPSPAICHEASGALLLRPVRSSDSEFLYRVYASTRTEELRVTNWSEEQKEAFLRMQFQAQHQHYQTHYPEASFSVIEVDGEPAGRLYVNRKATETRIVDIGFLPEYRGRGFGSKLLEDLQAESTKARQTLSIHVERFNPALALYTRLGFEVKGDQGVYLYLEWTPDS